MNTQELKIQVPQGYEIDKENSTFEKIIFKQIEKKLPMSFSEIGELNGCFIDSDSHIIELRRAYYSDNEKNTNIWKFKELAKASLALNQLIWLRDSWNDGWVADKEKYEYIYCITFTNDGLNISGWNTYKFVLSFKDYETATKFAKQFKSLILEAKPLL